VDEPQPPNPLSEGIAWASRIVSAALGLGLPVVVGTILDRRYGTQPLGTLAGLVLGFLFGVAFLIRMVRTPPGRTGRRD
jgi:F0F1-type ATP synthase assembly protein I